MSIKSLYLQHKLFSVKYFVMLVKPANNSIEKHTASTQSIFHHTIVKKITLIMSEIPIFTT